MRIIFMPFESEGNAYIENQKKVLHLLGHELLQAGSLLRDDINADAIVLQWYENIRRKKFFYAIKLFAYKVLCLLRLKYNNVSIITVFNNRIPHNVSGYNLFLSRLMMKIMFRMSDRILVMSEHSKQYLKEYIPNRMMSKVFLVPHPNYIKQDSTCPNIKPKGDCFEVLYTGLVRPYKNIELILDTASRAGQISIHFTIRGMALDPEYGKEIMQVAKEYSCNNVHFELEFIPDEEMDKIIQSSDIQVFPYSLDSSLQSGSIIHAFSNARTVICPNIPAIQDYSPELYYGYDYSDIEEHKIALEEQIIRAYNDWKNNNEEFVDKGRTLYETVRDNNSTESVARAFNEALKGL